MPIRPSFLAKVKKGVLTFKNEPAVNAYLWKFGPEEELEVAIGKRRRQRSLPQNSWYWGVVLPVIAHETGHSAEELHEIFKRMFLTRKIIKYRNKDFQLPGTTTDLNTMEFSEYVERVRAEAALMGINIPDPN